MSTFFSFLLKVGYLLISNLPSLDFVMPDDIVSGAVSIFSGIAYFLPMTSIIALFNIKISVIVFRIAVAVFKFVKSFIPGISGG